MGRLILMKLVYLKSAFKCDSFDLTIGNYWYHELFDNLL